MLERKWLRLRYRLGGLMGPRPKRVFFLHIPKCGGTSVHRHFKNNVGNGRSGRVALLNSLSGDLANQGKLEAAARAHYVSGHCGWNAAQAAGADAFRFTLLRDPFERLASLYLYARERHRADHRVFEKLFKAAKHHSFADFCLSDDPELRALIDNAQVRTLAHDYFPYRAADAATLKVALHHLDALDFVADAQDLDAVFPALAELTGTFLPRQPIRLNETQSTQALGLTRQDFMADRRLHALIAWDLGLYDRVRRQSAPALAA